MTDLPTVAKNLRDIEDMALRLESRAIDRAGARDIPGGDAMVNLASVGSLADWGRRVELREQGGDYGTSEFEDPDDLWPAVQVLWFWSEDYRARLGHDHDDPRWRPTLISEAKFLRNHDVANWIWDNEIHWDDYAADVETAKRKLENILHAGERILRGVPCMYDECKGKRLERKLRPLYGKDGDRVRDRNGNGLWEFDDWRCRACKRSWDGDEYARMVTAANERSKFEEIEGETWCSADYAARKVDRSVKTIRTWINREELSTLCLIAGRRVPFISLDEVRELAEARPTRRRRGNGSERMSA